MTEHKDDLNCITVHQVNGIDTVSYSEIMCSYNDIKLDCNIALTTNFALTCHKCCKTTFVSPKIT